MGSKFNCPHCGKSLKVIGQRNNSREPFNGFENTTDLGAVDALNKKPSLWWVLFGKGRRAASVPFEPEPEPKQPSVTVKVEHWDYANNQIKMFDMPPGIEWKYLVEIARMIIELEHPWTRENLERYVRLGPSPARRYVLTFQELGYLEVTSNNRSIVTPPGRRFLHGILTMIK